MPDYMFLLESRLSPEQRAVLERIQELARAQEMNVYLTGGAIRDLISGQPVRDLDFTVEGNPARMVNELQKGGARIVSENERLRHCEMIFAGDADGSISAARDDYYDRPGARPEIRFSSIMEDLRRRDFAINAVALSLNVQSRGLLLDPTNGLADIERQEVRALSIHAFTNQPIRLLRILRYCARMGFKMEPRSQEWFDLAMERGLHETIEGAALGDELRALAREENPAATLKQWDARGLLALFHPKWQRRKPDYDGFSRLARIRGNYIAAGLRPRLERAVEYYALRRLKGREAAAMLRNLGFSSAEIETLDNLIPEAQKIVKALKAAKMNAPREAYAYLSSQPPGMLVFIEAEIRNARAASRIRNYVQKWRPLHLALPVAELDALKVPRGPQFDKILEQLFELQLRGRGRDPEERTKLLRQLAGIKEEVKKKPEKKTEKEKKPKPGEPAGKGARPSQPPAPAGQPAKAGGAQRAEAMKSKLAARAGKGGVAQSPSQAVARPAAKSAPQPATAKPKAKAAKKRR